MHTISTTDRALVPPLVSPLLAPEWPASYSIGAEELENVTKTLTAQSPARNYGHNAQRFAERVEEWYKHKLGRKHALLVASGTTALTTAMMAADVGPGDEVLVPGYSWVSCISAVVRLGAIPRLVDIDDTYCMDPKDLKRKLELSEGRAKAVLLVHMSGACGDVQAIVDVCRQHNVLLIEDVAEANGATYHGRSLGSFGDMAIFSFHVSETITSGEGGMVVTDSASLHERAFAFHGDGYVGRTDLSHTDPQSSPVQSWGIGVRLSDLTAAMLLAQCHRLDSICAKMRDRALQLAAGLSSIPGCRVRRLRDPDGHTGSFVLAAWPTQSACVTIVERTRARGVCPPAGPCINNVNMDADWGMIGVNSAGRPWSDPLNTFHKAISYAQGALPVCDDLFARSMVIAVTPVLSPDAVDRIVQIYREEAAVALGAAAN